MPHCTPHAIYTSSLTVPIAAYLPLNPPDESEVTASFFATGEFDDTAFIRRCAFLSNADLAHQEVEADEEELHTDSVAPAEDAPVQPAVTVAAATAGSQMTTTPKLPGLHEDNLTVSYVAIQSY